MDVVVAIRNRSPQVVIILAVLMAAILLGCSADNTYYHAYTKSYNKCTDNGMDYVGHSFDGTRAICSRGQELIKVDIT